MKKLQISLASFVFLSLLLVGCSKEPFKYVPASGKVTYEDGTVIPADAIMLTFLSETPPVDPKTYPRPGAAMVDKATGEFKAVTTHKLNDGLVRGKHKVTLSGVNGQPLPAKLVPPEYHDAEKTPLEIDTANMPIILKVKKPQ